MRKPLKKCIDALDTFPAAVKEAVMEARSDEELVDVVGTVKSIERRYKPDIARALSEIPLEGNTITVGELHQADVGRTAKRTYNTPNLMTKMQDEGHTLLDLVEAGVITIKWNWTQLKGFSKRRDITLDITDKEVSELGKEDADVGELWQNTYPRWT